MAQNLNIGNLGQVLTVNVSSNAVTVNAATMTFGNSTVNCTINSTSVYVNGVDYNPTVALAVAIALS